MKSKLAKHLSDLFFLLQVLVLVTILIGTGVYTIARIYHTYTQKAMVVEASGVLQPRPTTYQVLPGDSIWSIYTQHYQGHDWDEVRYKVGQANGLRNDTLYPYTVIELPEVIK